MAAGSIKFYLTNGQVLSVWDATSEAINAEKRCNIMGDAIITSPYSFMVISPCRIRDAVVTTSVDGEFEFCANGVRTGVKFTPHAMYGVTVDRRRTYMPPLQFRPGIVYSMRQTVVRSA